LNKRELRLEKYGISNKRYKELCGFCEQYPEWLDELQYKTDTMKSCGIDGMPGAPTKQSDQTGNLAVRRAELRNKCELIEKTAMQADPDLYQYIIKSVCYEQPFFYLQEIMGMPCSRHMFYDRRRYFFYLLDKNKGAN
jgi:hypothetical protein